MTAPDTRARLSSPPAPEIVLPPLAASPLAPSPLAPSQPSPPAGPEAPSIRSHARTRSRHRATKPVAPAPGGGRRRAPATPVAPAVERSAGPSATLPSRSGASYRWSFISLFVRVALQGISGVVIARQIGPTKFGAGMLIVSLYGVASSLTQQGANGTLVIRRIIPRRMLVGVVGIDLAIGTVTTSAFLVAGLLTSGAVQIGLLVGAAGCVVNVICGPGFALTSRALHFGRISMGEIVGAILGTSVALTISTRTGSLVALPVQMVLIDVGIAAIVVRSLFTRPAPLGELSSADVGYRYGLQTAGNQLTSVGARNADNYLIALFLGQSALGLYVLAYRLMMLPIQNIAMVLTRVLVPKLRHLAGRADAVHDEVRKLVLAIALPVGALTGSALPFVRYLMVHVFGQRYAGAVGPTETLLIVTFPQCCVNIASCVFASTGHSRTQLRLTTTSLAFAALSVLIGYHWGIEGVTIAYAGFAVVLAVVSVDRLGRLGLVPPALFVEGLLYFLFTAAAAGAGSLVWRLTMPHPSLVVGLAELVSAAVVGVLVTSRVMRRPTRVSSAFWLSVVKGHA